MKKENRERVDKEKEMMERNFETLEVGKTYLREVEGERNQIEVKIIDVDKLNRLPNQFIYIGNDTLSYKSNGESVKYEDVCLYKLLPKKSTPPHYNNENGSLYKFAQDHNLNAWEFDLVKRIVRCRKKGQFKEDMEKTKHLIDLYLKEYKD